MLPVVLALISRTFSIAFLKWKLFSTVGRSSFGISDIFAIFQGNKIVSMQVSIMFVKGELRSVASCFINFTGT